MSVYESAAAAQRDTVKWLVAFVPTAALVSAGAVLGPDVVDDVQTAGSFENYISDHFLTAIGLIVSAVGLGWLIYSAAAVLSAEPNLFTAVLNDDKLRKEAVTSGVAAPQFLTDAEFTAAVELYRAHDAAARAQPENKAIEAAIITVVEWAWFKRVHSAFDRFRWQFPTSVTLMIAGFLTIAAGTDAPPRAIAPIEAPVAVTVVTDDENAFAEQTGCESLDTTTFLAVGGTWTSPVLTLEGPGCKFAATWSPASDDVELAPIP